MTAVFRRSLYQTLPIECFGTLPTETECPLDRTADAVCAGQLSTAAISAYLTWWGSSPSTIGIDIGKYNRARRLRAAGEGAASQLGLEVAMSRGRPSPAAPR